MRVKYNRVSTQIQSGNRFEADTDNYDITLLDKISGSVPFNDRPKAKELIEPLRQGLHNLKSEPESYMKFNPENGWGSYDGLVEFVESYLNACYEYPDADVKVSR